MSQWLTPEEARTRDGLRLVLTSGVPGPWGEAAKAAFHVKKIPHVRVAQEGGGENKALEDWTGERNAPQAVLDAEPARTAWRDIIDLAERMQPEPALCPDSADECEEMFDWIALLASKDGLGWHRRMSLFGPMMALPEDHPGHQLVAGMAGRYGYSAEAAEAAPGQSAKIVEKFSQRFVAQRKAGHAFLYGDRLSALDLYWAAFAALLDPLPHEICPMPEMIRSSYLCQDSEILAALDPGLLEHRTRIYEDWLEVPLDLGL